jgi:hypothetical protein
MADTNIGPPAIPAPARSVLEVIVLSAKGAFFSAIFVWFLGGVALSIAGSFAEDMVPAPPPGFGAAQGANHHGGTHATSGHVAKGFMFGLFFTIFFAHSMWVGLRRGDGGMRGRGFRIMANLREKWFGLLVGNAISAWVGVLVLDIVSDFSLTQILWSSVWGAITPGIHNVTNAVFGKSHSTFVSDWVSWYGGNKSKLYFWILYLGGAMDDLGVPNFKTLARWGWRKWQKRNTAGLPPAIAPNL